MNFPFIKNPIARFLSIALLLYVAWYLLYELWLSPEGTIDNIIIDNLIVVSSTILNWMGFSTSWNAFTDDAMKIIAIEKTGGVWIGVPCNGMSLFALFTGFIIAYPGKLVRKLIYIPIGILSIHLINVVRVVALCLIAYKLPPEYLAFNHTYTFTIIVYAFVFFLWMLWTNKYSK